MKERGQRSKQVWLGLSLVLPIYYGCWSLIYFNSHPDRIQDDMRLHVVWLQSLIDPSLFQNDFIARYYQAIQPIGFRWFYTGFAALGIAPLLVAKLLPVGLAIVSTVYLFHLVWEIRLLPLSAWLVTVFFNQNIWLKDDLISASPRAFVYPLLIAFLYYVVCRSAVPVVIILGLQGVFYPQILLVSVVFLSVRLVSGNGLNWRSWRWTGDRQAWWLCGLGWLLAIGLLGGFSQRVVQEFGSVLSAAEMRSMPEFLPGGRRAYFDVGWQFWFAGASGLRWPLFPPILAIGLGLPLLRSARRSGWLWQLLAASLLLFLAAHVVFPKLYLPSRYTFYSLRVLAAIAAGWVAATGLQWLWGWGVRRKAQGLRWRDRGGLAALGLLAAAVLLVPAVPAVFLPCQGWVTGEAPELYAFFAAQPPNIQIASLSREADDLPAFSQRSVLVGREFALPFHAKFYGAMQTRIAAVMTAQYSPDLAVLQAAIDRYKIDFWLLDRAWLQPDYLLQQDWLFHSQLQAATVATAARRQSAEVPALQPAIDRCGVFMDDRFIVVAASCVGAIQAK